VAAQKVGTVDDETTLARRRAEDGQARVTDDPGKKRQKRVEIRRIGHITAIARSILIDGTDLASNSRSGNKLGDLGHERLKDIQPGSEDDIAKRDLLSPATPLRRLAEPDIADPAEREQIPFSRVSHRESKATFCIGLSRPETRTGSAKDLHPHTFDGLSFAVDDTTLNDQVSRLPLHLR
jgi:hypothetical protein